jgi:hypothetical protein
VGGPLDGGATAESAMFSIVHSVLGSGLAACEMPARRPLAPARSGSLLSVRGFDFRVVVCDESW